jgi:hypothetical protein
MRLSKKTLIHNLTGILKVLEAEYSRSLLDGAAFYTLKGMHIRIRELKAKIASLSMG